MLSELSVKESSFIYYFLFSHNSCDCCAIPYDDVDQDKVGLKVKDREEENKEDDNDLEVLYKGVYGTNGDKEDERPNKTKELLPKYLSSDKLLPLNVSRETL